MFAKDLYTVSTDTLIKTLIKIKMKEVADMKARWTKRVLGSSAQKKLDVFSFKKGSQHEIINHGQILLYKHVELDPSGEVHEGFRLDRVNAKKKSTIIATVLFGYDDGICHIHTYGKEGEQTVCITEDDIIADGRKEIMSDGTNPPSIHSILKELSFRADAITYPTKDGMMDVITGYVQDANGYMYKNRYRWDAGLTIRFTTKPKKINGEWMVYTNGLLTIQFDARNNAKIEMTVIK